MATLDPRLAAILAAAGRAGGIPVVLLTRPSEPAWVVMPYFDGISGWLQSGHSRHAHHFIRDGKPPHWTVPKAWVNDLTKRLVGQFGACYLVQRYREQEKCAEKCWNAKGIECNCQCMGQHHGEGHPDGRWYEVSETCAISWGEAKLHYKLLKPKGLDQ